MARRAAPMNRQPTLVRPVRSVSRTGRQSHTGIHAGCSDVRACVHVSRAHTHGHHGTCGFASAPRSVLVQHGQTLLCIPSTPAVRGPIEALRGDYALVCRERLATRQPRTVTRSICTCRKGSIHAGAAFSAAVCPHVVSELQNLMSVSEQSFARIAPGVCVLHPTPSV